MNSHNHRTKSKGSSMPLIYELDHLEKTLLENKEIHIEGVIDQDMAEYVHTCFQHLKAAGSPNIKIFLRSEGGFAPFGFRIYDEIRHYKGKTHGIVNGYAQSMAAVVLQGCTKRVAYRHSTILVHETTLQMDLKRGSLTKKMMHTLRRGINRSTEVTVKILRKRTGKSLRDIRKLLAQDVPLRAEEALKHKLIDSIY